MKETDYPGIDYSLGTANRDGEFHYGVINSNELSPYATDSFESDYGEPTCPSCGSSPLISYDEYTGEDQELENGSSNSCSDYICESCKLIWGSDEVFGDESLGSNLDDGEYQCSMGTDGDITITKSPYYTFAQFCSPCLPGAGNLSAPCKEGPKTYCFGHDWFEGRKAPYPVYDVRTGELIPADPKGWEE